MAVNDQFFNLGNNPNLDAADTGIDPATGRILTPEERKRYLKVVFYPNKIDKQSLEPVKWFWWGCFSISR